MRSRGNERILKKVKEIAEQKNFKDDFEKLFREEFSNSPGHYKEFYKKIIEDGAKRWETENEN